MSKFAVITGAGTGIGKALAIRLSQSGVRVLAVGRRLEPLQTTQAEAAPGLVDIVAADVSSEEGREAVRNRVRDAQLHVDFLVHNAAVLQPICSLMDVKLPEWRAAMATNVEAPLFLTQALKEHLRTPGCRVLNVSTGAAHRPMRGSGAYCTSKAALHMLYMLLRDELQPSGILVGSVRPGVVDTPMQETLRSSSPQELPSVSRFLALKENNQLHPPEAAAKFLTWLLTATSEQDFGQQEWNIDDAAHKQYWQ